MSTLIKSLRMNSLYRKCLADKKSFKSKLYLFYSFLFYSIEFLFVLIPISVLKKRKMRSHFRGDLWFYDGFDNNSTYTIEITHSALIPKLFMVLSTILRQKYNTKVSCSFFCSEYPQNLSM